MFDMLQKSLSNLQK